MSDEGVESGPITAIAGEDGAGVRLDRWLASQIPALSRARLQNLIGAGHVLRDGAPIRNAGLKVKAGDVFSVDVPPPEDPEPKGEAIALSVVYEDSDLIVLDKPAGLVVHPSAGHATGTLVNALIAHCGDSLSGIGGVRRPGIVHRLDKDTSGLLVVAKTDLAHQGLADQFKSHGEDGRLIRQYVALVWGVPTPMRGRIDVALIRSNLNRTKIAVAKGTAGRHAVTHYEVAETFDGLKQTSAASLVRLQLETGRTHQIRVHLAHTGHPVLGDQTYGSGFRTAAAKFSDRSAELIEALGRQALHAEMLGFEHPRTGKALHFESLIPADMTGIIDELRSVSPKVAKRAAKTATGRTRHPR